MAPLHSSFRISPFSRDEATLYERVSVGWLVGRSVRRSVTLLLLGLLGATNAVYTALFFRRCVVVIASSSPHLRRHRDRRCILAIAESSPTSSPFFAFTFAVTVVNVTAVAVALEKRLHRTTLCLLFVPVEEGGLLRRHLPIDDITLHIYQQPICLAYFGRAIDLLQIPTYDKRQTTRLAGEGVLNG